MPLTDLDPVATGSDPRYLDVGAGAVGRTRYAYGEALVTAGT